MIKNVKCSVKYDNQNKIYKLQDNVRMKKNKVLVELQEHAKKKLMDKMETSSRMKAQKRAEETRHKIMSMNNSVLKSSNFSQEFESKEIKM